MAWLHSNGQITGRLGDLVIYQRSGSRHPIIRTKGGVSKEKIATSPRFANTRRYMSEFGGMAQASKLVRDGLGNLVQVSESFFAGRLTGDLKVLQKMDTLSEIGKRAFRFSLHPHLYDGYQLNKKIPFDSVREAPVGVTLDKGALSAAVVLPPVVAEGFSFSGLKGYTHYRWMVTLAVVPDLFYHDLEGYRTAGDFRNCLPANYTGPWQTEHAAVPATTVSLSIATPPPSADFALMVAVATSFGKEAWGHTIRTCRSAGCGKILVME